MFCTQLPATCVDMFQEGGRLKVVAPMVEMSCELPLGGDVREHGCQIRFHRLPVSCVLTPENILHDVLVGINTILSVQTRRCLRRYDDGGWQVRLGNTWLELDSDEATDVCACLDVIGQRYAQALREAATRLETWDYPQAASHGVSGVRLLSVHRDLWQLMRRFAQEFQATQGQRDRCCFVHFQEGEALTVEEPRGAIRAVLRALLCEAQRPGDYVALVYEYPGRALRSPEHRLSQTWQRLEELWTAACTESWLLNTFIPHVCAYYQTGPIIPRPRETGPTADSGPLSIVADECTISSPMIVLQNNARHVPWYKIRRPVQFIPYVADIQRWLAAYPVPLLSAAMLRPYYAAIATYIEAITPFSPLCDGADQARDARYEEFSMVTRRQVSIITSATYEHRRCADLLSQLLLQFLGLAYSPERQDLLDKMRAAIQPLWEQARFDLRYVIGT